MTHDAQGTDAPVVLSDGLDPTLTAPADAAGQAIHSRTHSSSRLPLRAISWSLYEGVRDPYVIMITIYIFAPYFATVVVGDPVAGQKMVANIGTIGGLFVAFTGPLLGASIDRIGRRKPLLLLMTALMVPVIAALWWAKPLGAGLSVTAVAALIIAANVLFAYSEVLHNSLLTRAATPHQAPHASGLALSLGNFVSTFMLIFVLWAFVLPGKVDWGFIPKHPLFGLNPLTHEPDRIVGPIVAAALAIGAIPLFLFTPDAERTGTPFLRALREGAASLVQTLKSLRGQRDAGLYLGARMLYTDGMTALLTFGGVYAAGVMHWGVLELLVYGICLSIFAVAGGFLGGWMDSVIGPRRAVQIEILGAIVCLVGQLGMGRNQMLFLFHYNAAAHAPLWNGPMFRTLPEVVYVLIGLGTAVFVTAQYASSRTLLTRLAPEGQTASFFGLYALSGTVTVWLGSLLVRIFTGVFKTQQAGFAPIALLLVIGFLGMLFVRGGAALERRRA